MKKIIALLLAAVCIFTFAGCGTSNDAPAEGQTASYADATEVLTKVWGAYSDDEKFMAWGGDSANMVDGAPGTFNVAMTDEMAVNLVITGDLAGTVDDVANLMHGMNLNMFTGTAVHTTSDASAYADGYAAALAANQWMCGFPEQYVVIDAGSGYVVTAFGAADLIKTFEEKALAALEGSSVIKSGAVVE